VFLGPLKALLGVTRADLTLVFALASAAFSGGMNLAPAPVLLLGCAGASALGAAADGLAQLAFGYGVLFGAGGGAAYILGQQTVNWR